MVDPVMLLMRGMISFDSERPVLSHETEMRLHLTPHVANSSNGINLAQLLWKATCPGLLAVLIHCHYRRWCSGERRAQME